MKTHAHLARAAAAAGVALLAAGCWEAPPVETKQTGFRGTAMEEVSNPRLDAILRELNKAPEVDPPGDRSGPPVRQIYKNVQVLGDLPDGEFLRLMGAITRWVAPEEEACNYCHNPDNLADDSKYQYKVARRMLQMTQTINTKWASHVGQTGVTCNTCHRGKPVPQFTWKINPGPAEMGGDFIGGRHGQNYPGAKTVGRTSLPYDPFTPLLAATTSEPIRVTGPEAMRNAHAPTIATSERTNALMVHMSDSLGVNCTYCHNSRNFADWTQAPPARTTAYHGIRLLRDINATYLDPLKSLYPAARLGPTGDAAKAYCTTCHQGVAKPFLGAAMLKDYPELGAGRR